MCILPAPRRFASSERFSRVSQFVLNIHCVWVCAAEDAPRDPFRLLERRHRLADVVERGAVALVRQLIPNSILGQSIRLVYAKALYRTAGASRGEVFEAVAIFEELRRKLRRVLGPSHPDTLDDLRELERARMTLEDYRKFKS